MIDWIPNSLRQRFVELLVERAADLADRLGGRELAAQLRRLFAQGPRRHEIEAAMARAAARLAPTLAGTPLGAALADPRLWERAALREALMAAVMRFGVDDEAEREALAAALAAALPAGADPAAVRPAVDRLLATFAEEFALAPSAQLFRQLLTLQVGHLGAEQQARALALLARFAATAPALPAAEPPALLHAPGPRENLPRPDYRSFVGRDEDLAWIEAQLDDPAGPAVLALVGVGGLGKSALAIAAGQRERETYAAQSPERRFAAIVWVSAKETALTAEGVASAAPDGLVFRTRADIYAAIARVLDLPAITGAPLAEQDQLVQQALTTRRTLLIVDNFESVADPQVPAFLRNLPAGSRAIVTSRVGLGGLGRSRELGALSEADARALLDSEAAGLGLEQTEYEASKLVALVGGLPLALKLSLARLADGEPFAAVARWLDDARGDLSEYCVAGQAERARQGDPLAWRLLLVTALFEQRGGAHPDALTAIVGVDPTARDTSLARLRRLGLVGRSRDGRAWMLPIVQRYALAALEHDPERGRLVEGWLAWAMTFAQTRGKNLDFQIEEAPAVLAEYPALRLAIDWCQREGRHAELLALAEGTWFLAELLGRFDELLAMVQAAEEVATALGDLRGQAFALRQQAWVQRIREAPLEATEALLLRAEVLAERAGDAGLLADIWYVLADIRYQRCDMPGAVAYAQQMVNQAARDGDERVRALGAYRMAKVALWPAGLEAALGWLDVAERAARALAWRRQVAWAIYRRGVTLTAAGRYAEAETALNQSLAEAQSWGEERFIVYALQRLVAVYDGSGRAQLALELAVDVHKRFKRLGIHRREFQELEAKLILHDLLTDEAHE